MSQIPRLANYDASPQKALAELGPAATNIRDGSRKHHISNREQDDDRTLGETD